MGLGLLLAGAGPASAHAALTGSDPRQGSVVGTAPTSVSLTFSEEVAMDSGSLRVLDPAGHRVDRGRISSVGSDTYRVGLRGKLPDGTFTVAYQVVSADSHPVSGAFTFSVGAPSRTSVSLDTGQAGGGTVGGLYHTVRYLSYASFVLLVGGAAFLLACWPGGAGRRPVQRLVAGGWVGLTAGTLLLLLMRGAYTGSGKAADIFDLGLLGGVLQTKTGAALVSRLLLLAVAALFLAVLFGAYAKHVEDEAEGEAEEKGDDGGDGTSRRDLAFGLSVGGGVVAAGLAATWAMSEHASVGLQAGLAMPVDVLHLLAVALWLGGLTTLLTALYRTPAVDASAVHRFSRLAFASVVVLAATGLYQSWRQLGTWTALFGTTYGRLLLAKVALVAVLVGLAYFSRRWTSRLTAPAEARVPRPSPVAEPTAEAAPEVVAAGADAGAGRTDAGRAAQLARQRAAVEAARVKRARDADPVRSGLRRSLLAEAGVAVVLLAVTTALTSTEPGRTVEEARNGSAAAAGRQQSGPVSLKLPFDTGGRNGKGVVLLDLTPGRIGGNELHLYVEHPDQSAFDVPEVRVSLTLKARDLGPLRATPERIAAAHWAAERVQVPMAGDWRFAVTVRTSDIDEVTVHRNAKIG
ncbi:copper resistance CopC/CopD family protein [Streptomyces sp. NPDC058045]|uniref:copper resistance CopC/CopD family protein n=1 Tax=Streptomyces sp. NPDC058045 TaxID=3346311 RepID=UPI0036E1FBBF